MELILLKGTDLMEKTKAFTIFETLIVVTIVAILVILSLKIYRNADEKALGDLYAKAFKTLNVATYNIQKDVDEYNEEQDLKAQEIDGKSGADDADKKRFPYIDCGATCDGTDPTIDQLCNALTGDERGYINNVGGSSCSVFSNSTFLSGGEIPKDPSFTSSDGMKYYLVDSSDKDYFFLWVDINGGRRPNSSKYVTGKKRPDVVPFIINKANGFVVPQGIPIYDTLYLKARVVSGDPELDKDYSIPMTFYEAQKIAFQGKNWVLDPMSKNIASFDQTLPTNAPKPSPDGTIASKLKCNDTSGYDVSRDFPPCTAEVNVFHR